MQAQLMKEAQLQEKKAKKKEFLKEIKEMSGIKIVICVIVNITYVFVIFFAFLPINVEMKQRMIAEHDQEQKELLIHDETLKQQITAAIASKKYLQTKRKEKKERKAEQLRIKVFIIIINQ